MKRLLLIILLVMLIVSAYSQVGIGNRAPDTNSILDLTNTNNRGLLLPTSASIFPTTPAGLLFFSETDSVIYYNEGAAYNGLSPWRYKFGGSVTEHTYFIKTGNVGIGTSTPKKKLHVKDNGEVVIVEGITSSFLGFYNTGYLNGRGGRIGFNSAASTKMTLENEILNGDIEIATSGSGAVNVPHGGVDIQGGKLKEYGNELLPSGAIIMWSGTLAPDGWALCDGGSHTKEDGSGSVTVPNLKGRFIVGYNAGDADYNSIGDDGGVGEKEVTLTKSQMPIHKHGSGDLKTADDVGHTHDMIFTQGNGSGARSRLAAVDDDGKTTKKTESSGVHNHTVTGSTANNGSGVAHENRPPYYTLAYIFKL
jgi:microcystin-dependent protein